jgi:predicted RNA-binding protein with PUA-like domain|tara:strand:- start:143 stop:472 length:330 start_codon:yes stop_codon:yes gene_type:complete
MNKGDKVFFYHSNCKPPGIVGLMEVIDLNIVDPTQFDKASKYYDPKSNPDKPRWDCVKVKYVFKSKKILSLPELKFLFSEDELLVVKKGNRLSILPIRNDIAKVIIEKI